MEPIEINAGPWYLRGLRDDARVSDVPALTELGVSDPHGFVAFAHQQWADGSVLRWAACVPTTGELVALIEVDADGRGRGRARDDYAQALAESVPAVTRFATSELNLQVHWDNSVI